MKTTRAGAAAIVGLLLTGAAALAAAPQFAGAQGTHGAAVSAVARGDSVGFKHKNHDGAVSAVARGNHGKGNGHHPNARPRQRPRRRTAADAPSGAYADSPR